MPYYDGSPSQCDEFIQSLDALQVIMDTFGDCVPIKCLGDFNVRLPRSGNTAKNWHRKSGFNNHSRLMNDFINGNDFTIVDHMFHQDVQYTYFNIPRDIHTWIDHVLSTSYDTIHIESCAIIPFEDGNVSDHLPIRMTIRVNIPHADNVSTTHTGNNQLFTNWRNSHNNAQYRLKLRDMLVNVPRLNVSTQTCPDEIQATIDRYVDQLTNCMIDSAKNARIVPKIRYQPKKYWCPDLSRARDTKRFWWRLWCDIGRPRQGAVYKCYKNTKKLYRKLSR